MWPFLNNMPTLPTMPTNMMSQMSQWQDMWMKPLQSMIPQVAPSANPMQQAMEAWQKMWLPMMASQPSAPQANSWPSPKVTVMTIELGDLRAYVEPAMAMMNMWQKMMPAMTQPGHNPFSHNLNRQNFWQAGRA